MRRIIAIPGLLTRGELKRQVAESMAKQYGIPRSTAEQMVKQADAVEAGFFQSLVSGTGPGLLIGIAAAALFVIMYAT